MHTAPPRPSFIHCAQDSPQPPPATADQLSDSGATASHVSVAFLPNCWMIGAGTDAGSDVAPPPPNVPLVMTRFPVPVLLTATNVSWPAGPPHVTAFHSLSAADVWLVQVIPSGLVMTRFPPPNSLTATNVSWPAGPPHVTAFHELFAADVRLVQVIPSGLVMTRFPVPVLLTATNVSWPAGPPHVTAFHELFAAEVWLVQVVPAELA